MNDSGTLLLAGNAGSPEAKIYQLQVTRDAQQHITGFAATATYFADAPGLPPTLALDVQGGIAGGLTYGPNGVLFYTSSPDGGISQLKPGSTMPSKQLRLRDLGIDDSGGGGLLFVPAGFPGAGRFKMQGWSSWVWWDVPFTTDGTGTYNLAAPATSVAIVNYGSGLMYVHGGQGAFTNDSVLIASQLDDRVVAYDVDSNGDPIATSLREFLTDFAAVRGAAVDPVTGDFLLTTADFNNPRIVLVSRLAVAPTQVRITSPAEGTSFTAPATFPVNADATQTGGAIARVDFYANTTFLMSAPHAPFSALADDLTAGQYTLTAVALDGGGNATTSAPVHISVVNNGPRITLVYPTNNTVLAACSDLTLVAQVQPGNSEIPAVEFFDGPASLGVSHAPYDFVPYRWTEQDLAGGTRTFSVSATDNNGLMSVAIATNVVVQPLPLHKLVIHHYVPGEVKFCFQGGAGSNYVWESSANLRPAQWQPFLTNTATTEMLQVTNQLDTHVPSGYYRTRRVN